MDVPAPTPSLSSYLANIANISLQYRLLGTWRKLLNASVLYVTVFYNIALRSATKPIFGSLAESDMRNEPLRRQSAI